MQQKHTKKKEDSTPNVIKLRTSSVGKKKEHETKKTIQFSHLRKEWLFFYYISCMLTYFADLSLLHFRQSIWQLSSTVRPPFDQGMIWSPCMSSNA
jgi:hypothetical protein